MAAAMISSLKLIWKAERLLRVKAGCCRQVNGTAGLPSAPEMAYVSRYLRLVSRADLDSCNYSVLPIAFD
jgi:hypothetical protein